MSCEEYEIELCLACKAPGISNYQCFLDFYLDLFEYQHNNKKLIMNIIKNNQCVLREVTYMKLALKILNPSSADFLDKVLLLS